MPILITGPGSSPVYGCTAHSIHGTREDDHNAKYGSWDALQTSVHNKITLGSGL